MSAMLMSQAWRVDLRGLRQLVLIALADYADPEGLAWPSVATLAAELQISGRTVQRHLRWLNEHGFIVAYNGMKGGRGVSTRYFVTPRSGRKRVTAGCLPLLPESTPERVTPGCHPLETPAKPLNSDSIVSPFLESKRVTESTLKGDTLLSPDSLSVVSKKETGTPDIKNPVGPVSPSEERIRDAARDPNHPDKTTRHIGDLAASLIANLRPRTDPDNNQPEFENPDLVDCTKTS